MLYPCIPKDSNTGFIKAELGTAVTYLVNVTSTLPTHTTKANAEILPVSTHLATASSLSKNSPSTIEISSMTRCWQFSHCVRTPDLWASSMHWCRGAFPEPIPAKIWGRKRASCILASGPIYTVSFPGCWFTCKGMERGATNLTRCHSCAGCGKSAVWRQRSHNFFQQVGFSSPFGKNSCLRHVLRHESSICLSITYWCSLCPSATFYCMRIIYKANGGY